MEFYNVKTRQKVDVAEKDIKKQKMEKKTSKGTTQVRYAAVTEVDGTRLFKFINEETYKNLNVPEA